MVARYQFGMLRGRADEPGAVRTQELEAAHVAAEGAVPVVGLAMDIVGDRAPHRHKLGAGGGRNKPALGDRQRQDIGEHHARLAPQNAAASGRRR